MSANDPDETFPAQTPQVIPEVGSTVPSGAPEGSSATGHTLLRSTATHTQPAEAPVLAGYAITHEIARGGMGIVYAATDLTFGRAVAVKTTKPGFSDDEFVREAEITARLAHPGIPPVHALGTLPDGRRFLAMKLIRGETLQRTIDSGTDRATLLATFEQICQAVGYAHAQGIVHRDLKPANVMVGQFGEVQVMDWGLARTMRRAVDETATDSPGSTRALGAPSWDTLEGAAKGTPAYIAPEQARGEWAQVGPRADVFALGGILCAILTGKPPFAGANWVEALECARRADLSDARGRLGACGADAELLELCQTCLAERPDDRYADGTVVARAVAAYRAGVEERLRRAERDRAAAEARATEEANTRREQRKRARAQLLLACATVLLVAAGGAFAWYSADRKAKEAQLEGDKKAAGTQAKLEAEFKEKQAQQGIDANLILATDLRKVYNFAEADRSLLQALELAKSGAPERVAEVERAREDLAFVRTLDDIRFRKWAWQSEIGGKGDFNTKIASPEYTSAFAKYGLDLKALAPADAAARISASRVKAELVAAVDDWALYEPNEVLSERLLDVAHRADRGPWLDRLRDPKVRADKEAVAKLAKDANVRTVAPAALSVLAELMKRRGLDPSERLTLACAFHPREFELAFARGLLQQRHKDGQQIGPFEAARALRPDNTAVWNNLGNALRAKGDEDGAIAAYKRAIELDPKHAPAHFNLGTTLGVNRDTDAAIAALNRAIEFSPKYAPAHAQLGNALRAKGDTDGAIAAYKRATELDPKYANAHNNLGNALRDRGDLAGAITAFKRATELDPKHAPAHHKLSIALSEKGDADGASAAYKRAIELELDPKHAPAYYNLGLALRDKGDLAAAITAYKRATELDPKLAPAHHNLGNALGTKGDAVGAIAAYKRAIELDSKLAPAHYALGIALSEQGDADGASTALKRAIELNPKHAPALYNLGNALRAKGDTAGAIAAFKRAIELDPQLALAHTNLGIVLHAKGETHEAIAAFQRAIELVPKHAPAHTNLGIALRTKGDTEGALAAFNRAIELDPKNANAHNNLGNSLRDKGDLAGAIAAYKRATELDPKLVPAHHNLGIALSAKGDADGAIAAYKRTIELDPKYTNAHNNLGLLLRAKGDLAGAIAAFKCATELAPKLVAAHHNLGLALGDKGDTDGAIAAYKRAIELDSKFVQAHNNLGATYLQQKRYPEAAACARAAIKADPLYATAHAMLGEALVQQGDIGGARAAFTEAARLDKRWVVPLAKLPPVAVAPPPRAK